MRTSLHLIAVALLALACRAPDGATPAAAEEGTAIGQRAPDFMLPSSDGGGFHLAEQRGRPVVLVFFRGTW